MSSASTSQAHGFDLLDVLEVMIAEPTKDPQHYTQHGAPVLTDRGPHGTRAVPGRSLYGGYDLSAAAEEVEL